MGPEGIDATYSEMIAFILVTFVAGFGAGWLHLSQLRYRVGEKTLKRRVRAALAMWETGFMVAATLSLYAWSGTLFYSGWGAGLLVTMAILFAASAIAATRFNPKSNCPDAFTIAKSVHE